MGRLTQNLQFNVGSNIQYAQQKGIAGSSQAANDAALSPALTETMKTFLGAMPKLARVEMREGRKTLEQGRLAGFRGQPIGDVAPSGFGAEFEKSAQQVAKELRESGEITLVDDPYFQEGYFQAQGEMMEVKFANETKAWYEGVKENPNLYKDREAFENALRLRFDLAFSQLPRNKYIQAGFMKNISPLISVSAAFLAVARASAIELLIILLLLNPELSQTNIAFLLENQPIRKLIPML